MQRVLQLRRGERQGPQHRQREDRHRAGARRHAQPAFRQRTQQQRQRQRRGQRPQRRGALVLRQRQVAGGQQRPRPAEQAPGQQRDQCHHEQVEQAPLADPRIGRAVHADRAEQAVAMRQVQGGVDAFQRQLPAGAGNRAAMRGQAQAGVQVELLLAQLDAAAAALALADQQRLAILAGPLQLPRRRHVQALVMTQFAAEAVGHAEAAAVEVQPQLALQVQLVALAALVAARTLLDRQAGAVVQHEGRQLAPFARHAGLGRVGGVAFHPGIAQGGSIVVAPDLLPRPRCRRQLQRHLAQRRDAARGKRDRPLARPQLHAQLAVVLQPCRQVAGQGGGHETFRQHRTERLLARAAGDVELQPRFQRGRQAIGEAAVNAQRQCVGGALRGGGLAQGELVAVAFDARDRRTIDAQCHQPDAHRHAQACRAHRPRQHAAQLIVAGRQPQHRLTGTLQHGRRLVVRGDLLRPVLRVTGQRHPARRIHVDVQAEAAAVLAGIEDQPTGPGALIAAGVRRLGGKERTSVLRHVVQYPALPVAQRRRYVLRRQRCRQQQPQAQQSERSSKHAVLPVCRAAGTV